MKNSIKKLISDIKNSLSSKDFYQSIISGEKKDGLKYLIKLSFVFGFFAYVFFVGIMYFSPIKSEIKNKIYESIPSDFVLTIKGGELSINQPMPFIVKSEESWVSNKKEKQRTNLFVIDTTIEPTLKSNQEYDTTVFVSSKNFLVERDYEGEIRSMNYKTISDTSFSREDLLGLVNFFFSIAWLILLATVFAFAFVSFFSGIFTAFFASVALLLLRKIVKQNISFKQAFQVSLFAYTIAYVLELILFFFGKDSGNLWFKVLIVVLMAMYFTMNQEKKENKEFTSAEPMSQAEIDIKKENTVQEENKVL